MPKTIDITGQQFGRLTALELVPERKHGGRCWLCKCSCGTLIIARADQLKSGDTRSCGCLYAERSKGLNRRHGQYQTAEYNAWAAMRQRCSNPKNKKYESYGGRGICVCDRWQNSFENFFADMGPRPSSRHSIDRIDNNSGYSPGNCRWTTPDIQAKNQRKRRLQNP